MYVPEHFKLGDVAEQHALMRAYPFAALITMSDAGYEVTHLPTKLKSEGALGVVECHVSRANPHWREIAKSGRGLLMYTGPQAYITPGWYPSKAAHGKVVPTWNYAVVHAHGTAEIVDDREWLVRHVSELTDQQEAGTATPWATSDAPGNYIEVMSRGIVGMRFTIERLEGKAKMSQNREIPDREGVVAGLKARAEEGDAKVADLVASEAEKARKD
ncbi:MAG: FMN-binding negative transcriptional regulator [Hyphomicrobium sp.]|nr:FMN-binding negative transcriptional regulator [Hyphomicrobium sp.]